MSSWIIAKSRQQKKKAEITKYHDTSRTQIRIVKNEQGDVTTFEGPQDTFVMYTEFIAAYAYSQKMGELCNIWDASGLIKNTLKQNPQVKLLKEKPEADPLTLTNYQALVSPISFKDIQKMAANLIVYDPLLNQTVVKFLEKSGIKGMFDIGIHLIKDPAGPNLVMLKKYAALLKAYQAKAKLATLNLYIMADSYAAVQHFQSYCDSTWKITSMSKTPLKTTDDPFIQAMAEVQIMTAVPALILDFDRPVDRFIYLMQRNPRMAYFTEFNGKDWKLF